MCNRFDEDGCKNISYYGSTVIPDECFLTSSRCSTQVGSGRDASIV